MTKFDPNFPTLKPLQQTRAMEAVLIDDLKTSNYPNSEPLP